MLNKRAIIFPGSGAQHFFMGKELDGFSEILDQASRVLNTDLLQFNEDKSIYQDNSPLAEVILMLTGYASFNEVNKRAPISYVAGQSSGQLTGALVSGMLTFDEAVQLTYEIAKVEEDISLSKTRLLTCANLNIKVANKLLNRSGLKDIYFATINSPINFIFGGDIDELKKFAVKLRTWGAKCDFLNMPAFHTILLKKIEPKISKIINNLNLAPKEPQIPFISDLDNRWNSSKNWLNKLVKQDTSTSNLDKNLQTFLKLGVNGFVTVDCGGRLSELVNNSVKNRHVKCKVTNISKTGGA